MSWGETLLSGSGLTTLLTVAIVSLVVVRLWIRHHYAYWKRHNVPYIQPNPIFGNFKDLFLSKKDPCDHFKQLYDHPRAQNQPVVGLYVFNKPCLLLRDLDLIKSVLVKDFNKFSNRYTSSDPHSDSLGADNLFFAKNPKWKEIRVKMTPFFSSGKLRMMFPLIEEIGREFDQYLCSLTNDPKKKSFEHEVKEINGLYTTDVIAICAYGIRANSLRNPDGDFRTNGKRIFHFTRKRAIEMKSMFFAPLLVRLFHFKAFSKQTTEFLRSTLNYVMDDRMKSGATRNDLIDILVSFRRQAEAEPDKKHFILEGDCLVAQAAIFFSAGFETSSSTISFSLYELSRHKALQQRLRAEIRDALQETDGKVTYEMITEMKYLNNVVQEVLRLYPPLSFLDRVCTLPVGERSYSLKPHIDFDVPDGMPVYIPMCSLQRDPKYFPNPDTFDPDRFAPENRDKNNFAAYMPFGTGPHNCIAERFGLLETKVGIINFLRNHYVTPTPRSHPEMKLDPRAMIIQSLGGIYLNLVRDPLL